MRIRNTACRIRKLRIHAANLVRILEKFKILQQGQGRNTLNRDTLDSYLRCRIDTELELGLLPVVDREALHEQGGEPRPCASTEGVEDEESLESSTLVSQLSNAVQDNVHDLLTYEKFLINICSKNLASARILQKA
jgi:hypothetical protein